MNDIKVQQRIEWIDVAKGLGILMVILGHSVQYGGTIHNLIFSFHMPLFFILSGMVYKKRGNKSFIKKKSKSLMLPYIIFFLIGLVITVIIPEWRASLSAKGILKDIYLGNPSLENVSSIWFLMCLFVVSLIFNYIQKFNKKSQYIIIVVCLMVGFLYSKIFAYLGLLPDGRLPLDIEVALVAIFFYAIGSWINQKFLNKNYFFISCIIFVISFMLNGTVNLHGMTFNNPIIYILEALSGSVIIICFCYFISTIKVNIIEQIEKLLLWLGGEHFNYFGCSGDCY